MLRTNISKLVSLVALFVITSNGLAQTNTSKPTFDVLHYDAEITPDINNKSVSGNVTITFKPLQKELDQITLSAGRLRVKAVIKDGKSLNFRKTGRHLVIRFDQPLKKQSEHRVRVSYQGKPSYGVRFFPEKKQVYTIFSTSQWMPCVDSPDDRATFDLSLKGPTSKLEGLGNGEYLPTITTHTKIGFKWRQKVPVPTFLFGFAIGDFRKVQEKRGATVFRYMVPKDISENEALQIFRETISMLEFFERKSGMRYPLRSYTQVLAAGSPAQEMSGFAVMGENYGRGVLKDEKAIWLGAHEFAHQWWGNMVTNRDWTHFWLNEGLTNFLTAAYLQHRFGNEEYKKHIQRYRESYETVKKAGNDKPLKFPDWDRPTRDDRRIVYNKGAYFVHLLRLEMGEVDFWKGIKQYTQKYWGKSVVSKDFQRSMEKASGKDLSEMFDRWVFGNTKTH